MVSGAARSVYFHQLGGPMDWVDDLEQTVNPGGKHLYSSTGCSLIEVYLCSLPDDS